MGALKIQNMDLKTEYPDLKETRQVSEIVYGPVDSRRLGSALGINLSGSAVKICAFDCSYCDLGPSDVRLNRIKKNIVFPTPQEVAHALSQKLDELRKEQISFSQIIFSGNGEPTLHPEFPLVVDEVLKVRELNAVGTQVSILTSGSTFGSRRVMAALNLLNERMVKLDAGSEKMFKRMNSPLTRITLSNLITSLAPMKDCIIQSFFVQGAVDNTATPDIEDWIEVIGLIKPKLVHIHGMNRIPAHSGLIRADENTLYSIAARLERKTHIKSLVFP